MTKKIKTEKEQKIEARILEIEEKVKSFQEENPEWLYTVHCQKNLLMQVDLIIIFWLDPRQFPTRAFQNGILIKENECTEITNFIEKLFKKSNDVVSSTPFTSKSRQMIYTVRFC